MSSGAVKEMLPLDAFEATQDPGHLAPALVASAPVASSHDYSAPAPHLSDVLCPLPEREYVDVRRAGAILGLSTRAIFELYKAGQIEMIDYAKRKWKRVRYQSIVNLCDKLREKYCIADRRPPLSNPMFRHRDADLLPFPLEDTIDVAQTMQVLGYISEPPVYNMITEGRFEAYHFLPNSPWRISQLSLADYVHKVQSLSRSAEHHHPRAARRTAGQGKN